MVPLIVSQVSKSFVMHMRGGLEILVVANVDFRVDTGECAVLGGPSGIGKSSILKMIYGNYLAGGGQILVQHGDNKIDVVTAEPRKIVELRRETIGYVSQFLRVLPRVAAIDVVAEPLLAMGTNPTKAQKEASVLLERLNLPERLWSLPPATFSGGEQQRVNIARGFITDHPILLLDEPTASLDAVNRQVAIELIEEKKKAGTALLGIFHDLDVREAVADRIIDVSGFAAHKAA